MAKATTVLSEYGCGLFGYQPRWMQRFATVKMFMIVFSVLGTIQAMTWSYFTVTIPTMEKRFKSTSQVLGWALSGNEISQILFGLILSYYGSHSNRPAWMAAGSFLSALATFILLAIHLIYGAGDDAIVLTKEYHDSLSSNYSVFSNISSRGSNICWPENPNVENCDKTDNALDLSNSSTIVSMFLIFLSQFIVGVGTTMYYIFGMTYMDDNSKKVNTPTLIATSFTLRTLGPIIGMIMAYFCLNVYIDPSLTPLISRDDPRWLGAWWIGWIICGVLTTVLSVLIAFFPRHLKVNKDHHEDHQEEMMPLKVSKVTEPAKKPPSKLPSLKEFPSAIRRLLKNKIIMYNIFTGVFFLLGAGGYMTYFAKYYEIEFQVSTQSSGTIAAPITFIGVCLGLLVSGHILSRYRPSASKVLIWNATVGVLMLAQYIIFIMINCSGNTLQSYNSSLISQCNMNCGCEATAFSPVCDELNGITYFSPCHAGCTVQLNSTSPRAYTNCSCITQGISGSKSDRQITVTDGYCDAGCFTSFAFMVGVFIIISILVSSGRVGNVLVGYRAVAEEDKSLVQGLGLWILSLLAFIPGPVIYGYIFDSSCLYWNESCGVKGNCLVYDKDAVRWRVNGAAFVFSSIGLVLDVLLWYEGRTLELYDDSDVSESDGDKRN